MKPRIAPLVALGATTFLVTLIATLPAALAARWIEPPSGVGWRALEGSVWRGSARDVRLAGAPPLERVHWELHVLPLLVGRLGARLELAGAGGDASFRLRATRDGALGVDDARARLGLDVLARAAGAPPGLLAGELEISRLAVELAPGQLARLECAATVHGLAVIAPQRVELGELAVNCATGEAGPEIRIEDQGGPLAVQAQVLLERGGRWALNATLGARPGAPQALRGALPLLGAPDGEDRVRVKLAGDLPLPR